MVKVVFLGSDVGYEAARATLAGRADVLAVPPDRAELMATLVEADGLLDASMRLRLDAEMIAAASRLRIVSCATTGSDHIDKAALEARGIALRTLREDGDVLRGITPAAELSFALLLALARGLPAAVAHVRDGRWERESFPGTMLNGRTLGLIGCGRIGGWMARYAQAFGMRVLGYDPLLPELPPGVERTELRDVFVRSDFISVHVHLTDETRGLVSRELIAAMKPTAYIVNTARGAIIDEDALLEALENRRIGGAGLDVLEGEPAVADHPLVAYARRNDNLLITPHCGGNSPDAVAIVCQRAAEKIRDVLEAGP